MNKVDLPTNPKFIDLTDRIFTRLTVLYYVGKYDDNHMWACECIDGNIRYVSGRALKSESVKSCGCLAKGHYLNINKTHGFSKEKMFNVWKGIISRCCNPKYNEYKNYGARGITVCEEWKNDYLRFKEDVGEKPSPEHSLDRIDNNGNYCKENCRWATPEEQSNNKRTNAFIEYNGKTLTVQQWSRETGIKRGVINHRLSLGWDAEKILTTPVIKNELITYSGKSHSLNEWSKITGISWSTLNRRLKDGWSLDETFTTRPRKKSKSKKKEE